MIITAVCNVKTSGVWYVYLSWRTYPGFSWTGDGVVMVGMSNSKGVSPDSGELMYRGFSASKNVTFTLDGGRMCVSILKSKPKQ